MLKPLHGPQKDIEMMSSPEDWPIWPRLPLKRTDPRGADYGIQVGYLIAIEGQLTTVFLKTIFEKHDPETEDKKVYQDVWAIQDDGWVVD